MTESEIQRRLVKQFEGQGWLVVKLVLTSKPGMPDLLLLRDGVARFVEVKRNGVKPRPLQNYRIAELNRLGFDVDVIDDKTVTSHKHDSYLTDF